MRFAVCSAIVIFKCFSIANNWKTKLAVRDENFHHWQFYSERYYSKKILRSIAFERTEFVYRNRLM